MVRITYPASQAPRSLATYSLNLDELLPYSWVIYWQVHTQKTIIHQQRNNPESHVLAFEKDSTELSHPARYS